MTKPYEEGRRALIILLGTLVNRVTDVSLFPIDSIHDIWEIAVNDHHTGYHAAKYLSMSLLWGLNSGIEFLGTDEQIDLMADLLRTLYSMYRDNYKCTKCAADVCRFSHQNSTHPVCEEEEVVKTHPVCEEVVKNKKLTPASLPLGPQGPGFGGISVETVNRFNTAKTDSYFVFKATGQLPGDECRPGVHVSGVVPPQADGDPYERNLSSSQNIPAATLLKPTGVSKGYAVQGYQYFLPVVADKLDESRKAVLECTHLNGVTGPSAGPSADTGVLPVSFIMRWKARRMMSLGRKGISVNSTKDSINGDRKITVIGSKCFQLHLKYFDSHESRCGALEDNFNYVLNPIKVPAEWESWKKKRRVAGARD
jgi:hypothetical protein